MGQALGNSREEFFAKEGHQLVFNDLSHGLFCAHLIVIGVGLGWLQGAEMAFPERWV